MSATFTSNIFPPVVLLVIVPGVYFCHRLGLLRKRPWRIAVWAIALVLVALSLPYRGLELGQIKATKLFLAAAIAALLGLRHRRIAWVGKPRQYLAGLGLLATLSGVVYYNFFAFHGQWTFVQLHDVAHYYLGSKYFEELGYDSLYTAMLRAEAEVYENRFKVLEARDLENNEIVDIRVLLRRSHEVKAHFSEERWDEFKGDVRYFREVLGSNYPKIYSDQGFNASPFWALVGGTLARWIPASSSYGVYVLSSLDLLLLALLLAAVLWAFGTRAVLLAGAYFFLAFGAGFAWTGGSFLRFLWLGGTVIGLCCLHRRRPWAAGGLLAVAVLDRIFPIFFVLGIGLRAAHDLLRHRRLGRFHWHFFAAFAGTVLILFLLTGFQGRGLAAWIDFQENTQRYVQRIASNVVGATTVLSFKPGPEEIPYEEFAALRERRTRIYHWQLATLFVAAVVWLAWSNRRRNDLQAAVAGLVPLFFGLNLACYYYVMLLLLILAHRRRAGDLAVLFAGEACAYVLMLFEPSQGLQYVYRSASIGWVLGAFYLRSRLGVGGARDADPESP